MFSIDFPINDFPLILTLIRAFSGINSKFFLFEIENKKLEKNHKEITVKELIISMSVFDMVTLFRIRKDILSL
jgi:hypothetical protein